jgi:hypothetical protein
MNTANIVLLRHATLGLLLGASAGVAWSMRAKRVGGGVASLFYPTRAGGQVVAGKAIPEKPVEDVLALRARAIAKGESRLPPPPAHHLPTTTPPASLRQRSELTIQRPIGMGFGIMGAISGVQVGVWTGSMAGKRTIAKRPGCEVRVARVMNEATQELKEAGLLDARFSVPGLTAAANAIQPNAREAPGLSEFEPTKEFYANEVPDEGQQFMERREEQGATSAALEQERSRWDELRKSKAAPPSSWDIREYYPSSTVVQT